ncbi:MAG: putative RNA methylase, partial [Planctomycetota bacterium]
MSDRDYFDSYAGAEVHRLMLADRVRTDAYRNAIESLVQPGMIVLDVGCGTGILSLFAARAGAEQVYAVDRSEILEVTERIVRANDLSGKIKCFAGRAEWIDLPSRVDLIVSEWMGFFALAESMFESVTAARDKHLAVGGHVVPGAIKLCLTPVEDKRLNHERGLGFWTKDVYGFDYTPMLDYEIADLETVSVLGGEAKDLAKTV